MRCVIRDGQALSRALKPIPNRYVQALLSLPQLEGLDGELVVGVPVDLPGDTVFQRTQSGVMSHQGEPAVTFWVFDHTRHPNQPFTARFALAEECLRTSQAPNVHIVPHVEVRSAEELATLEEALVGAGYEGVMLRRPDAPYKFGRATDRDGSLVKVMRFVDEEAVVVDTVERQINMNPRTANELGLSRRSSAKAGKVPAGDLGALVAEVQRPGGPVRFEVGAGFSHSQRQDFWLRRQELIGRTFTFKHFAQAGVVEAPRQPVFKGFRED